MSGAEPQKRHWSRRLALQALYQWQLTDHSIDDLLVQYATDENWSKVDKEYFVDLVQESIRQYNEIIAIISKYTDISVNNIDPVEKAVLLFSIYELLYKRDTPASVVISEAVILCKKFGSVDGFKYINGVLDKVFKNEVQ